MRVLTLMAWMYLVIGLASLSLPIAVVSYALSGKWNVFAAFMAISALCIGIGLIWISVTYLREKGRVVAESMATFTGTLLWLLINTKSIGYVEVIDEKFGALAGFGVILLPIIISIGITNSMKFLIHRTYEGASHLDGYS